MAQPKIWPSHNWPSQIFFHFGWANNGPAKNLAQPYLAQPYLAQPIFLKFWLGHSLAGPKLAAAGPATWPSQNWASSQTLAQPKSGKNWPSQKSGPAIIGPAKFWPSHIVEKIGPAKIWPSHKWPSQILAQPKFGKKWPSQNLAEPILAAGPVLGFSPTLIFVFVFFFRVILWFKIEKFIETKIEAIA